MSLSQLCLVLFVVLSCSGQLLLHLGGGGVLIALAPLVVYIFLNSYRLEVYLLAGFVLLGFLISGFVGVTTASLDSASSLLALLTFLSLLFLRYVDLESLSSWFVNFALVTVVVSILISLLSLIGLQLPLGRTSTVLGLNRLTFLFDEPSHYAVFLSLSFLVAVRGRESLKRLGVLGGGLVFTWSLSGLILLFMVLMYFYFRRVGLLSASILFSVLLSVAVSIWGSFLSDLDFWLVYKLHSLLLVFSGETIEGSALVRAYSSGMWYVYLSESFSIGDYASIVFGEGYGNLEYWVESFYSQELGIYSISTTNNFISSLIVSGGLFGFVLYLISWFGMFGRRTVRGYFELLLLLVFVSMFSGYAFGSLALLFFFSVAMIVTMGERGRGGRVRD